MTRRRGLTCLIWLALAGGGCDTAPTQIVFEGKMPPHLRLGAAASLSTGRDFFFCRKNWFTSPRRRTDGADAHFERFDGERYRATIDLRDSPHGGLCKWHLTMVIAGIEGAEAGMTMDSGALKLSPSPIQTKAASLPHRVEVQCRPYMRHPDVEDVRCDPYHKLEVDSFSGETRIELNVHWDPTPWYPPEWDTYPEYRPDGWEPGMPMPPPTL